MADLIFSRPPYAGGPVNLVFGATDGPALLPVSVVGVSALGGVSGSGAVALVPRPVAVAGVSTLGGVSAAGLALYDNRNPRRASTRATLPHQVATQRPGATASGWRQGVRTIVQPLGFWQLAAPTRTEPVAGVVPALADGCHTATIWSQGVARAHQVAMAHQTAAPRRGEARATWETGQARARQAALVHQAARSWVRQVLALWQQAQARQVTTLARSGKGVARLSELLALWETAQPVPPGLELWPPVLPVVPPRVPSTHLVFACPPWAGGAVHLVFGHVCTLPTAPIVILPARYYMAVHSLTCHQLPSLEPVPIFNVSLSADAGSFAWTFSASAPASVFEQLAPASGLPARVRITLDGLPFVFLVDSLQREEAFGKRSVRISGRSATALLARPYARETARLSTDTATAQQLAEAALEYTGAALDWGITDWLVPAGAWSHTGTPLAAVQAIAEAAGGYVQSHRSAATLLVRHPYPELPGGIPGGPWNWASTLFGADVELAPDAIITSGIERRDGPDINAVWVSGTTQGVLARVKRTGTAADKLASLITDPLITATEAAQQRGLSVLGAAGPKHLVQIELPILTGAGQPGVLDVGQLVQINDASPWRGRVRSVSVNATMPKARQIIQLERHLEIA